MIKNYVKILLLLLVCTQTSAQDFAAFTQVCQIGPFSLQSPLDDNSNLIFAWQRSFDQGASWQTTGLQQPYLEIMRPQAGIRYRMLYANNEVCLSDPDCRLATSSTELQVNIPEFSQGVQLCEGDSILVGTQSLSSAGNHTTIIRKEDGCDSLVNTYIHFLDRSHTLFHIEVCQDTSLMGIAIHQDTVLQKIYTSQQGCDSIVTWEVVFSGNSNLEIIGPDRICQGEVAELRAPGQYDTYSWNTGSNDESIRVQESGTYQLTLLTLPNCTLILDHHIEVIQLSIDTLEVIPPTCQGSKNGAISIAAQGDDGLLYSIDGGESFRAHSLFEGLSSGSYTIEVQNAEGCSASSYTQIDPPASFDLETNISTDTIIESGDSLKINVEANFEVESWQWSPDYALNCNDCSSIVARPYMSGSYTVQAIAGDGCSTSKTIHVEVVDSRRLYAPSAFSPNGDNKNDRWQVFPGPKASGISGLTIADRWGGILYQQSDHLAVPGDPAISWDGTRNGKPVPPGYYIYYATIHFSDGGSKKIKGKIALIL